MTAQLNARISKLDLTGRSFLTIHDFSPAEVRALLDLAAELKTAQKMREPHAVLAGRAVALIFMKTSTRTRMSFEVGVEQLGAQPMFLNAGDIQLSQRAKVVLDIDRRKVGQTVDKAIFAAPNCTKDILRPLPRSKVR